MNMKPILAAFALVASVGSAFAQLIIPSDGSDGAFSPAANIEIDLSQAVTGTWSNPSTSPGNGIYDAQKWAIVFKYSSVNIPGGVTVTFKNHPSYAPVVWLVQGSATIAGTVSLDGKNGELGSDALTPVEPGPGGFRGGPIGPSGNGAGLGIGGGASNAGSGAYNGFYGNPQILPLIGGSGAASWTNGAGASGGGGGGALLLAASSTIQVTGSIRSLGGTSGYIGNVPASGGGIKLIADQVTGNGTVNAATSGRTRIEANTLSAGIVTTPPTIAVPPGTTPTIFQSNTSPTVKIISVDGLPSPADPTAPLVSSADIAIQKNTPVTIVLKTYNFSTAGGVVTLRIANKFGGATTVNATLQGGTSAESTWTVNTTLAPGFVTLQARATAP
jgi:hypothetical protein